MARESIMNTESKSTDFLKRAISITLIAYEERLISSREFNDKLVHSVVIVLVPSTRQQLTLHVFHSFTQSLCRCIPNLQWFFDNGWHCFGSLFFLNSISCCISMSMLNLLKSHQFQFVWTGLNWWAFIFHHSIHMNIQHQKYNVDEKRFVFVMCVRIMSIK